MPRVCADRVIMWAVIGIVAWAVIGLPAINALDQTPAQQGQDRSGPAEQSTDTFVPGRIAQQSNPKQETKEPDAHKGVVPHNFLESAVEWAVKFFELKLTDVLIVFFTGVLAVKTAGLFKETAGLRAAADQQASDMKASIAAAKDAAAAAERSAIIA